jgi:hypothetical protein
MPKRKPEETRQERVVDAVDELLQKDKLPTGERAADEEPKPSRPASSPKGR